MIVVVLAVLVLAGLVAALVARRGAVVSLKRVAVFVGLLVVGVPTLAVLIARVGAVGSVHHGEVHYDEVHYGVEGTHQRVETHGGHHTFEVLSGGATPFAAPHVASAPQPPQPPPVPWQVEPELGGAGAGVGVGVGVAEPADDGEWFLKLDDPSIAREPHASKQTLHAFIAQRVEAACEQVGPGGARRVIPGNGALGVGEAARALADRIGAALDGTSPPARPPGETWVKLRTDACGSTSFNWWPEQLDRYTLVAEVVGPRGSAVVQAKLDEKPWLTAPPRADGRREYMVVTSGPPAGSKDEALDALRHRLAPAVTERVFAELRARPGARPSHDHVRRQVEARYGHQTSAADACVVALDRPYGRVWFAASLIDVGRDDLDHLAATAQAVHTRSKQSFAGMVVALAGMLLVLGVVYAGLNALTRGYFRGQLRTAVVVALAVAVAVVFMLIA